MVCIRGHVVAVTLVVAGLLTTLELAAGMPWEACGNGTANYTVNSIYQGNLGLVAAALPSNVSTSPALFATAVNGAAPDKVYAIGVCRGDQNASACQACIAATFRDAQKLCPYNRGAAIFYDTCLVGFSDRDLLVARTNSDDQEVQLYNAQNVTSNVGQFNATVYKLLGAMAEYVETINSERKFATGTIGFDDTYPNIYSMVWCTPDLTHGQCRACLAATIAEMPRIFIPNTRGARITGLRCSVRYEVYPFYNGAIMLQLPGTSAGVLIHSFLRFPFSYTCNMYTPLAEITCCRPYIFFFRVTIYLSCCTTNNFHLLVVTFSITLLFAHATLSMNSITEDESFLCHKLSSPSEKCGTL